MKKITLHIFILLFVFTLSNYCYLSFNLYKDDIKKCNAELLFELDSLKNEKKVLYFGESSNFTYALSDSCKLSIAKLISTKCLPNTLGEITKGAIHSGTFEKLIKRIDNNSSIETIIVTVNLRSFGINWIESDLETNLSRAEIFYGNDFPVFKKLKLSFKMYDNVENFKRKNTIRYHYKHDKFQTINFPYKTIRDWDKFIYSYGIKNKKNEKDKYLTELACHFVKNYAFSLTEENPRIKNLDEIVSYCSQRKIKIIFHILPENIDKARFFFGSNLTSVMKNNVTFLINRYKHKSTVVNNFELLRNKNFIDTLWPTEHYNFEGRNLIAEEICKHLKDN